MLARSKKIDSRITYRDAGVDVDAADAFVKAITPLADRTRRLGSLGRLGGYGGLFDLKQIGYEDPILVSSSDGVGTKIKIAVEMGLHDSVGIDLVAMSVNDILVQGAEPLFFLDYFAYSEVAEDVRYAVLDSVAEGCVKAGAELIGGETAKMPGMYQPGDYDLAGFAVGVVERSELLPSPDIRPGDAVIGLASSGVHSNGFSLIRRLVKEKGLRWTQRADFAPDKTLGAALLAPTKIYVRSLLNTIRNTRAIKALAHITGSGHIRKFSRVLPSDLVAEINLDAWKTPEVFRWIMNLANINDRELLRTFNCGIGMVIVTAKADCENVMNVLRSNDESPFMIGTIRTDPDGSRQTVLTGNLRFDD